MVFIAEFLLRGMTLVASVYGPVLLNTKFDLIPQILIEELNTQDNSKILRWYSSLFAKPIAFRICWINIRWTMFVAIIVSIVTTLVTSLFKLKIFNET